MWGGQSWLQPPFRRPDRLESLSAGKIARPTFSIAGPDWKGYFLTMANANEHSVVLRGQFESPAVIETLERDCCGASEILPLKQAGFARTNRSVTFAALKAG